MRSGFVRSSELYHAASRTPIVHPADRATDADVRRALADRKRELRADGGTSSDNDVPIRTNGVMWPDQSGSDHSWSQFGQTKSAKGSPSLTYFATRSPSPSSQLGQRANIQQLLPNHHRGIRLLPRYVGWWSFDRCVFSVETLREQGENSRQRTTSVEKGVVESVEYGAIHLSAWKSFDPQEQDAVPMGRMLPFRSFFAAYADPQQTHTATTRLWSRKAITPQPSGQGSTFNSCEKYQVIPHRAIFVPVCTLPTRANCKDGGSR